MLPRLALVADVNAVAADTLQRDLEIVLGALDGRRLMVIDRDVAPSRGGTEDRTRLARLRRLRELTAARGAMLVVTGRADLAVACDADGVQLPERGLSAEGIRQRFGAELAVGRSCHDRAGLFAAQGAGAAWATLAPVRVPWSKAPSGPPLGVAGVRAAISGLKLPVFALGGIGPLTASDLRAAGAWGVATIGYVFGRDNPAERAMELLA